MLGLWSSLGAVISEVLRCRTCTTLIILWSCQQVISNESSLWSSMAVNIHWRWTTMTVYPIDGLPYWRCTLLTGYPIITPTNEVQNWVRGIRVRPPLHTDLVHSIIFDKTWLLLQGLVGPHITQRLILVRPFLHSWSFTTTNHNIWTTELEPQSALRRVQYLNWCHYVKGVTCT